MYMIKLNIKIKNTIIAVQYIIKVLKVSSESWRGNGFIESMNIDIYLSISIYI